jgi:hypothetical protein
MAETTDGERPSTGMKLVSMRMSEDTWAAIQHESEIAGVSASEFIREAAIFRLAYRWAQRADDDEIARQLRKLGAMPPDY